MQDEVRKLDDYFVAVSKSLAELDWSVLPPWNARKDRSQRLQHRLARRGGKEWRLGPSDHQRRERDKDQARPSPSCRSLRRGLHPQRHELGPSLHAPGGSSTEAAEQMGGRGLGEVEWPRADEGVLLPADLSVLVVTGANFSGKSAYLKQVALLLVLCQVGSFVPAEAMTFGIHDAVLTRVATRESVARGESAFMIDLQQVSHMLRNATDRSLLLIDEFGKGTDAAGPSFHPSSREKDNSRKPQTDKDYFAASCGT